MSAPNPRALPQHSRVEIGVVGRSNVGKSSLLGMLLGPALVRTSRTPGQTRLLNLFEWQDRLALVDLPGYGFAKASHTERARLRALIEGYIRTRDCLQGVVLLLDARREGPSPDDVAVAELIVGAGRLLLPVVSKVDLVPKNRRRSHLARFEQAFGLERGSVLGVSAKTGEGKELLIKTLKELA